VAVLPNNDSVIIVSTYSKIGSIKGVSVYCNGKLLPKQINNLYTVDNIIPTNNDTLYGYVTQTSGYDFSSLVVSLDSGVSIIKNQWFRKLSNPRFENGVLYDDNGFVINPDIPMVLDTFQIKSNWYRNSALATDLKFNRVYMSLIDGNSGKYNLSFYSFNSTTKSKIGKYTFQYKLSSNNSIPVVSQLVRFGKKGLAVTTYDEYISDEQELVLLNNALLVDSTSDTSVSLYPNLYVSDTIYNHVNVNDTLITLYDYHTTKYDTSYKIVYDTLYLYQTYSFVNSMYMFSTVVIIPDSLTNKLKVFVFNEDLIQSDEFQIVDTLGNVLTDFKINKELFEVDISTFGKGTFQLILKDPFGSIIANKKLIIK